MGINATQAQLLKLYKKFLYVIHSFNIGLLMQCFFSITDSKSLKDILGPPDAYVGPPNACLKSVFKPNVKPVLSPTSSSSAVLSTATSVSTRTKLTASFGSSSSSNSCSNNSNSNSSNNNSSSSNSCSSSFNGISTPATASSATTSSKTTSENVIT